MKRDGLSGPHHHGGHRRGGSFRYNTYTPMPWWYSPMQYAYEEEEVWDAAKAQWVRRPVRRVTTITDNPPEGEKYGVFGAGADAEEGTGMLGAAATTSTAAAARYALWKYSRGVGTWRLEGSYASLAAAQAAVPALRQRYGSTVALTIRGPNGETYRAADPRAQSTRVRGTLGDDGDYGVLSYLRRPYGSLSKRYQGNTGSLSDTPAPAPAAVSPLRTERAAKCMLVGIGIVTGLLLLK